MEKIFIDTDVILDLLSAREPHYQYAALLFSKADEGKVKLFVSSLTFANVHYVLSRQLSSAQAGKMQFRLKTLVSILAVNDKIIDMALASDFRDFEDAIQYHTALEHRIKTLITRNLKDYKKAKINVLTAQQYLKIIE